MFLAADLGFSDFSWGEFAHHILPSLLTTLELKPSRFYERRSKYRLYWFPKERCFGFNRR